MTSQTTTPGNKAGRDSRVSYWCSLGTGSTGGRGHSGKVRVCRGTKGGLIAPGGGYGRVRGYGKGVLGEVLWDSDWAE